MAILIRSWLSGCHRGAEATRKRSVIRSRARRASRGSASSKPCISQLMASCPLANVPSRPSDAGPVGQARDIDATALRLDSTRLVASMSVTIWCLFAQRGGSTEYMTCMSPSQAPLPRLPSPWPVQMPAAARRRLARGHCNMGGLRIAAAPAQRNRQSWRASPGRSWGSTPLTNNLPVSPHRVLLSLEAAIPSRKRFRRPP